ncbi:MAG: hypothetical protein PHV61_05235 [Limnochordia bacterium]|jgi:hypothetical protein|nr:hypothetical protein [Limnochordia bacterium]MDD2629557.1 hypothetical protein [Limnochordia bacterium]MDD4518812.1 hypothetical protein [Limnochordia bacterium]
MGIAWNELQELEKQGYSITKIMDLAGGGAKVIMTNVQTNAKKVVRLNPEDKTMLEARNARRRF